MTTTSARFRTGASPTRPGASASPAPHPGTASTPTPPGTSTPPTPHLDTASIPTPPGAGTPPTPHPTGPPTSTPRRLSGPGTTGFPARQPSGALSGGLSNSASDLREQGVSGLGIGWRPEIAGFVSGLPGLRLVEVIAESLPPRQLPVPLQDLRRRGVTVIPHGVRLSLGSAEPINAARAAHLAHCAELTGAPLVSEHIAFVRAGGLEAGHLLPLPRSWEAVDAVVANVRRAQESLPVPIALEPIAQLFDWPDNELTEAQFLIEILERTDALLLLDLANVYANAVNRGLDPLSTVAGLPLERWAYAHVAGGAPGDGRYHDTHTDPVPSAVLELVAALRPPALLLERDGNYPPAPALVSELDALAAAAGHETIT